LATTNTTEARFNSRLLFEGGLRVLWALLLVLVLLASLDWLLRSDTYKVGQLQFEGSFQRVSEAELEKASLSVVRGNYLMLNLDEVRKTVEALPWVSKASVRRSWPDGVHIKFIEQQPVANWGSNASLGTEGQVIPAVETETAPGLPNLSGPEGTSRTVLAAYERFSRITQTMDEQIRSLTLTSRHTWQITLASGVDIVVDQEQSEQKLERLARVYRRIDGNPSRIDLRYTNGFAVKWKASEGVRSTNQEKKGDT
jgi:cell division protein FtsQ